MLNSCLLYTSGKRRVEGLQKETNHKIEQIQTRVEEKYSKLDASVSEVKDTTTAQEGKIAEFRVRELRLQEEINALKGRPLISSHISCSENREAINFKNYKRNPIEFIERVEENLARTRETRWTVIKGMIDEMFKEVHDNWWTAVRPDIHNFNEFKKLFKDKYWSEATQHVVRNNISNGRFDPYLGQSPTAYFLGKVSVARNLEPNIPEECLVTQLAYHYDGEITKSRLSGRIKTIQEMAALLGEYEREKHYVLNRQKNTPNYRNYDTRNHPSGPQGNNTPANHPPTTVSYTHLDVYKRQT